MSIRSVYDPYADRLPAINGRIAQLMAAQEGAELAEVDLDERAQSHLALLEKDRAPSVLWSLVAVLAFLGWCGCLFGLAAKGFDDRSGYLLKRPALRWLGGVVGTMAVWVLGLWMA